MANKKIIEAINNKLIETYKPLEIYLFGSYAWGSPDEESDLDLLIVVDNYEDEDERHQMLVQGHLALSQFRLSKDLFLFKKRDFEDHAADITTLCYKVKKHGIKIYAKT